MTALYTSVGHFEKRTGANGNFYPVVIVNRCEYMVSIPEMIVWTSLCWRILDLRRIQARYEQRIGETGLELCAKSDETLERLVRRGLVVCGLGSSGADALYDLLDNLYIVPVTSNPFVKALSFLKLFLLDGHSFHVATGAFRRVKLTQNEKLVIDLARQAQLSTTEMIRCVEVGAFDISDDMKVLETIYDDDETTCDNVASYARFYEQWRPVLAAVSNLYLKKQILFERY